MKCFDIHQGVIIPGLNVTYYTSRPCYQLDNRALYLADSYLDSGLPTNRVYNADFVDNGRDSFEVRPESLDSKDFALVVIRSKQTTAEVELSVDTDSDSNRIVYQRSHVQTRVKIEKDMVTFRTVTAVVILRPGETFTLTGTFRKREKQPLPRSFAELIDRLKSDPVYSYTEREIEKYHFDGTNVRSLLDRFGKPID